MPASFGASHPVIPAGPRVTHATPPSARPSADAAGNHQPSIRWHYTFFVLAAFGIAAITASLSFSRALTEDFAQAVASNYEWVD